MNAEKHFSNRYLGTNQIDTTNDKGFFTRKNTVEYLLLDRRNKSKYDIDKSCQVTNLGIHLMCKCFRCLCWCWIEK